MNYLGNHQKHMHKSIQHREPYIIAQKEGVVGWKLGSC